MDQQTLQYPWETTEANDIPGQQKAKRHVLFESTLTDEASSQSG